jgi:Phosphotransferase enzyme family
VISEFAAGNGTLEYIKALGSNEIQWVKTYAKPRMNFHRSTKIAELPNDVVSLLTRYMMLAPYLVPNAAKDIHSMTLSHPDLHLDNIFVDPGTRRITHIVDWQSASVCEMFLQRRLPPMLPDLGVDSPDRTIAHKLHCHDLNAADVLSHYEGLTKIRNPRRWAALKDDSIPILTKPISLVSGAWSREDVFSFRHALITVIAHWNQIAPESVSCPVSFTANELELHQKEMELIEGLGTIMHQLHDENMIPLGGMVQPENYQQAQEINKQSKEMFVSLAENDEQKILHSKVWPYQDV